MKIERYLDLLGDQLLRSAAPEGPMVVSHINKYSDLTHVIDDLTGNQAKELIFGLDPYHARKLMALELNDGLDAVRESKALQARLEQQRSGKYLKPAVALGMSFLITVLTLAITAAILWVTYHTKTLPDWEQLVLPYIIPGVVMWQYFGIINEETRALMSAIAGSTPAGSTLKGLLNFRGKDKPPPTSEVDTEYDNPRPPPPPRD